MVTFANWTTIVTQYFLLHDTNFIIEKAKYEHCSPLTTTYRRHTTQYNQTKKISQKLLRDGRRGKDFNKFAFSYEQKLVNPSTK